MCIETREMDSSALARQRRKVKLNKRRREDSDDDENDPEEITSDGCKKPHITGIKRQARYDPGVAMTRDELTEWRKEARRVRNRESAAESRQRTRARIELLEGQLGSLEAKYAAALKRIVELEAAAAVSNDSVTPITVSLEAACEEPIVSPSPSPLLTSVVSPVSSPRSSFSLNDPHHQEKVEEKYKHIMDMISRPTA